jgi:hypothetical protein
MITAGLGVHSGYFQAGSEATTEDMHRPVYGFHLRLEAFKVLAVSFSYDLNAKRSVVWDISLPYPSIQLTGHIYFIRVGAVSLNIFGGIGINTSSENNGIMLCAYIVGSELEVKVHKHVAINLGVRFLLPSFEQVMNQRTGGAWKDSSLTVDSSRLEELSPHKIASNIFDFRNFQILFSVRTYI